ncbi:MAG: methionyl-tRNA formyltransferase [Patescibacteria group bacterium]
MNYIFFGSPDFAAIILEKLINAGFIPEAVVCNPDKPIGRKKIITPPPVKKCIMNKVESIKGKIKIFQPEKLSDIKSQLSDVNCQLFIVVAYSKIISKEILEIPRLGTIGVHPSLLPKYRGSSPIQTAILNGEKETGTTLYLMDEKVDHGKIVSSIKYQVSSRDNYESLMKKLAELSAELLINFLQKYENVRNYEKITGAPQNESSATYTKKFKSEDGYIEPRDIEIAQKNGGEIAIEIERKIRALNPEPGVWTVKDNKRIKLLEAAIIDNSKLELTKIQKEGKKPIKIKNPLS